jgi:glycosyltransferase involved in cell wall biosynthesis
MSRYRIASVCCIPFPLMLRANRERLPDQRHHGCSDGQVPIPWHHCKFETMTIHNRSLTVQATPAAGPLVSVVTPFFNTAPYLAECIESVLAQSYSEFEYILMDNCSTDGSSEIAESYAHRDPRIRLIRCSEFVSQLQNFNRALAQISEASQYCKIVCADDYIFPECLQLMIRSFEQSGSIGLVSSYCQVGATREGSPNPFWTPTVAGIECARWFLRTRLFLFGSPTTVMYRSTVVRHHQPFYDESALHADTEKCMEILQHWDFGFVHQVLSFLRTDNESITSALRPFQASALDRYIIVQRYASVFLEASEAASLRKKSKRAYYRVLAKEAVRFRGPALWQYHKRGLRTLSETLDLPYLALQIGLVLLWIASNPRGTMLVALRSWKGKINSKRRSKVGSAL